VYVKQKKTLLMNHDTVEVLGDEQVVTGVKALNKTTNEEFEIPVTGFSLPLGTNQILIF
jgi:thioredoxin reductase (NADPH)